MCGWLCFSMPIAGPVSILITSHGLRGELRYCFTAALGAAIVDVLVCFFAVHGAAKLLGLYAVVIPYALLVGAGFLFIVGLRIVKARFDFAHMDVKKTGVMRFFRAAGKKRVLDRTGFERLQPSLLFGWLTSSFIIMSFVSSMGLHVGGLDHMLVENVASVNKFASHNAGGSDIIPSITTPSFHSCRLKTNPQGTKRHPDSFRFFSA